MRRLLVVLSRTALLPLALLAAADYFFLDSALWRIATGSAEQPRLAASASDDAKRAAAFLEEHYQQEAYFPLYGWTLRRAWAGVGGVFVMADYPLDPDALPFPVERPIYPNVVANCPLVDFDTYWKQDFAQPFTIYLSRQGENGAASMARCTSDFDTAARDAVVNRSEAYAGIIDLPKPGDDPAALDATIKAGSPSFQETREAIQASQFTRVQLLLSRRPELVHMYDGSGNTLLHYVDDREGITVLVGFGARPNTRNDNGVTPLANLVELSKPKRLLRLMIELGGDPRYSGVEYAETAELAEFLVREGALITGESLYTALANGHLAAAEVLYANGARFDDSLHESVLHRLVGDLQYTADFSRQKKLDAIDAALNYGADPDRKERGMTALEYAESRTDLPGREEAIRLLTREPAPILL